MTHWKDLLNPKVHEAHGPERRKLDEAALILDPLLEVLTPTPQGSNALTLHRWIIDAIDLGLITEREGGFALSATRCWRHLN